MSFGGGGGSPSVGAPVGRVGCGVGVDVAAGFAAGVAGVGVGLGAWVVRGRSWLSAKTLDPKIMAETIKPQIARIAVRLTFCVLNNGKLLWKPRGLGQTNTATLRTPQEMRLKRLRVAERARTHRAPAVA